MRFPQPCAQHGLDRVANATAVAGPAPFAWATGWAVVISLAALGITAAASVWMKPWLPAALEIGLANAVLIGIGSGTIAVLSLTPGLVIEFAHQDPRSDAASRDYMAAVLAGILIRLLGTVALFLLCRYQMAPSADTIAGWVLSWYVLLTATEVVVLSKRLSKSVVPRPFHRPSQTTPE